MQIEEGITHMTETIDAVKLRELVERATPGPWRVETRAHPGDIDICTDEHEPWFIAIMVNGAGFNGNDEHANARLIALTPTLARAHLSLTERAERAEKALRNANEWLCAAPSDAAIDALCRAMWGEHPEPRPDLIEHKHWQRQRDSHRAMMRHCLATIAKTSPAEGEKK